MFFRAMRASLLFSPKHFPRDQTYWEEQGWLEGDARYFYPAKVNPLANFGASFFERFIRRSMNKDLIAEE